LGKRRLSHAKKRANSPSMPTQYFNAGETSPQKTSHFKYRSSDRCNPELGTALKVMHALSVRITA
jgi:hypothetical protein